MMVMGTPIGGKEKGQRGPIAFVAARPFLLLSESWSTTKTSSAAF